MSNDPGVRAVRRPTADFNRLRIPRTRQPERDWFRVHQIRFPAVCFSLTPTHRFSHADCPDPLLYLAADIDTCLFERFADKAYDRQRTIARSLWAAHSVTRIWLPELHVCDLTSARTLTVLMADLSALLDYDVATPQQWGLAIQCHPAHFQGIKYKSRFNGRACLALFQRDQIERRLRETPLEGLLTNDAAAEWLDRYRICLY